MAGPGERLPRRKVSTEERPVEAPPEDTTATFTEQLPKTPERFREVQFRLVRDKRGEIVGYKSSEYGRKEIALDPSSKEALGTVSSFDTYTVRVIEDTNPGNPDKGSYIVQIDDDKEHKGAQLDRSARLRNSNGFKTLAQMIKADPDLTSEYEPVVRRSKEYKSLHSDGEERHRNFTGMLAGIMMSERGNALLNQVIDRTIKNESDRLKEKLYNDGPQYIPSVVDGAGVTGTILAATRQAYLPDVPELTMEARSRIGGQFAQYGSDLFRLNSRRRAEQSADKPHLPGTSQSLNTFGEHAVMQSSDTGHESYAFQTSIADTARVNFFLSGKALVNAELVKVRKNYDPDQRGTLVLEYLDRDAGRIQEITTDRLTVASGVGVEESKLDPEDVTTQTILREEAAKRARGDLAQVYSFSEIAQRVSDPSIPFPLKGVKQLVLSGGKDSGTVIAGIMLGYEGQLGKTSAQLDSIEEIVWLGQQFESKEEFLQNARARYAQVGLEFPRITYENYYHRIKPIPDFRSFRLERGSEGKIKVILQRNFDRDRSRKSQNYIESDDSTQFVEGDQFVYAHGFVDKTDELIAGAFNYAVETPDQISIALEDLENNIPNIATEFYFKEGPIRRIEFVRTTSIYDRGRDDDLLSLKVFDRQGLFRTETISFAEFKTRGEYFDADNIERIEEQISEDDLSSSGKEDEVYGKIRGKNRPLARSYGFTYDDPCIYKVGPAAALDVTREDQREAPVLGTIQENSAAIFRYAERTVKFAEMLAKRDKDVGEKAPDFFTAKAQKIEQLPLPNKDAPGLGPLSIGIRSNRLQKLPLDSNSSDLLKLAAGDCLSGYSFPEELSELTFVATRTLKGRGGETYDVTTPSQEYDDIARVLFKDPLAASVIKKSLDAVKKDQITIRIPIAKGKALGAETTFTLGRA